MHLEKSKKKLQEQKCEGRKPQQTGGRPVGPGRRSVWAGFLKWCLQATWPGNLLTLIPARCSEAGDWSVGLGITLHETRCNKISVNEVVRQNGAS